MIPGDTFCRLLLDLKKKEKKLKKTGQMAGSLTFFEILTLCAFEYFSQEKVDLAMVRSRSGRTV
jgi:folylpolyglutamate synthase/dihydropteroate synthase